MPVDAAAASESTPTGVRVLVVDDDVVICRQMAANLSSAGDQKVSTPRRSRPAPTASPSSLQACRSSSGGSPPRPPTIARSSRSGRSEPRPRGVAVELPYAHFVDIARFEDAAVKPMVAPTRVHQILESVLEVSASSLGRGVTISIDCKADLMARFDAARVERVLHNLAGNAARYCNQGGTMNRPRSVPASSCGCPGAPDAICSAHAPLSINRPAARRGLG